MSRQIEEQAKGKHRETKGDKTKKELYTTALRLFREKGYENVSISEIAREAGTAKGTFYIHFPSKAAVVTEMLHYYDDTYEETAGPASVSLFAADSDPELDWGILQIHL